LLKDLGAILCLALLLIAMAGCGREEAHQIHLRKGVYAGSTMTKLDARQVSALERRASHERD
jgi:hypothetical protein